MIRFLLLSLIFLLCGGCATPAVVQVAGMGMTGYDAAMLADDYLPRERVAFNRPFDCNDAVIERRMDERLLIKGYPELQPFSFGGHVYLVGEVLNRSNGKRATEVAQSVQGIKSLTTHFFPLSQHNKFPDDQKLRGKLYKRFKQDRQLGKSPLRVTVVQSNAIVMGPASSKQIKLQALETARTTPGISKVIDYVVVAQ